MAPARSRMDEPLVRTGSAPALDQLVPDPTPLAGAEPDDALSALLAGHDVTAAGGDEEDQEFTDEHLAQLEQLDRYKAEKRDLEKRLEVLNSRIGPLQVRLLELIVELGLDVKDPFPRFEDGTGDRVRASVRRTIYPKYRDDPQSGKQYTRDLLIDALEGSDAEHCVQYTTDRVPWERYIRDRAKGWKAKLAKSPRGIRNTDGVWHDHDGLPLEDHETGWPNALLLCLPRAIRRLVEPVEVEEIRFTRTPIAAKAAADHDTRAEVAQRDVSAETPDPQ